MRKAQTSFDIVNLVISHLTQASKPQTASSKIMDPVLFVTLSRATALVVNDDNHSMGTVILILKKQVTACTEKLEGPFWRAQAMEHTTPFMY